MLTMSVDRGTMRTSGFGNITKLGRHDRERQRVTASPHQLDFASCVDYCADEFGTKVTFVERRGERGPVEAILCLGGAARARHSVSRRCLIFLVRASHHDL